jgi:[protein-PII] uridylyltransferase
MVYSTNPRSYIRTTGILDEMGLNVVDARIVPASASSYLNTYCVLDASGEQIGDIERLSELRSRLMSTLTDDDSRPIRISRRVPRQVRMFSTPVQIQMTTDSANQRTIVELVASDRPGLLFQVAQVLDQLKLLNPGFDAETVDSLPPEQRYERLYKPLFEYLDKKVPK